VIACTVTTFRGFVWEFFAIFGCVFSAAFNAAERVMAIVGPMTISLAGEALCGARFNESFYTNINEK